MNSGCDWREEGWATRRMTNSIEPQMDESGQEISGQGAIEGSVFGLKSHLDGGAGAYGANHVHCRLRAGLSGITRRGVPS